MTNKKTFMTASFEICNSDVFHFVLYFCSLVSGLSNVSLQTKWLLMKYFITFLHLTNGGLMRQLSSILLPSAFCKDGTWDGLKDWFFHWFSTIKHWRSQVWWLNSPGRIVIQVTDFRWDSEIMQKYIQGLDQTTQSQSQESQSEGTETPSGLFLYPLP